MERDTNTGRRATRLVFGALAALLATATVIAAPAGVQASSAMTVTINVTRAGLTSGARVNVTSDRDVTITLTGHQPVHLPAGQHTIMV